MKVRKAEKRDIPEIILLLHQVLEVHAELRPDLFISGTTKYNADALEKILENSQTPVFVCVNEEGEVKGYAFCIFEEFPKSENLHQIKTLYIDDICVDKNSRGKHIGTMLYYYVVDYAKKQGCYNITLNVWEGNHSAKLFYKKMGMFERKTQMEFILK